MRAPRLRLYMLLILVAIVALGLGFRRHYEICQRLATLYAAREQEVLIELKSSSIPFSGASSTMEEDHPSLRAVSEVLALIERDRVEWKRQEAASAARLKEACRRAAYWPWLSIPPDPPERIILMGN